MKLLVVGCGQCGGRIADEFARRERRAREQRGLTIVSGALAINTDVTDLSGLSFVRTDPQHRILIGTRKSGGHGVGKINELGAEIAREEGDQVLEAIERAEERSRADAFLLAAGAAGGTGSGVVAELTQQIKERHPDRPVYCLIVLPFRHEELTEERAIYNVGTCLKSVYLVADAVFLVDNQRYIADGASIRRNLARINTRVVDPFYNLLCAGEEKDPRFIGSRVVDAGDIIQTISGWTVIGHGQTSVSRSKFPLAGKLDFRSRVAEAEKGMYAMNQAIATLSVKCRPEDARKALYLLTAPPGEMSMNLIKDLSMSLRAAATEALIRSGDYPRGRDFLDVTVILSELTNSARISDYFTKAIRYVYLKQRRRGEMKEGREGFEEALRDIPLLL